MLALLPGVRLSAQAPALRTIVESAPRGRKCAPAELPDPLPPGRALVDSTALVGPLGARIRALLSLRFGSDGRQAVVTVLETDGDLSATEALRSAVQAALRLPQPAAETIWAVRLRVVGGNAPSLTVEPSLFCGARPRGAAPSPRVSIVTNVDTVTSADSTARMLRADRQQAHLAAILRISEQGTITQITLTESSGQQEADEQYTQRWQRIRFFPALLDGVAIEVSFDSDSERSTPE